MSEGVEDWLGNWAQTCWGSGNVFSWDALDKMRFNGLYNIWVFYSRQIILQLKVKKLKGKLYKNSMFLSLSLLSWQGLEERQQESYSFFNSLFILMSTTE